jgi:hypothetical protein
MSSNQEFQLIPPNKENVQHEIEKNLNSNYVDVAINQFLELLKHPEPKLIN